MHFAICSEYIDQCNMLGWGFGRTDFSRIFVFEPPDFSVVFLAGYFSLLIFAGKSAQKNPARKSPANPPKLMQQNPRHISAEGPGFQNRTCNKFVPNGKSARSFACTITMQPFWIELPGVEDLESLSSYSSLRYCGAGLWCHLGSGTPRSQRAPNHNRICTTPFDQVCKRLAFLVYRVEAFSGNFRQFSGDFRQFAWALFKLL